MREGLWSLSSRDTWVNSDGQFLVESMRHVADTGSSSNEVEKDPHVFWVQILVNVPETNNMIVILITVDVSCGILDVLNVLVVA